MSVHIFSTPNAVPNGHIFVSSPSIRRRNSTWKVRGNYIDFENPPGNYYIDWTWIFRWGFDFSKLMKYR